MPEYNSEDEQELWSHLSTDVDFENDSKDNPQEVEEKQEEDTDWPTFELAYPDLEEDQVDI